MTVENAETLVNPEGEIETVVENQQVEVDNNELDSDNEVSPEADVPSSEEQKPSKSQNAKQRLRRKLREMEVENLRLKEADTARERRIADLESKIDPILNPPPPRPNRVDYESEEEYEDSLFDWRDKSKPITQNTAPETNTGVTELPPLDVPVDTRQNWEAQLDIAADKYDDFEDVLVSIPREGVTDTMTIAIMESKNAGDVAYFLGENHGEAKRIAQLSIANQVREIDKLGSKFNNTTSAPDPISDVNHRGDSSDKVDDPILEGATFE